MNGIALIWVCDKCGWRQPRHKLTEPKDMPECSQRMHSGEPCGGTPQPKVRDLKTWEIRDPKPEDILDAPQT